MLRAHGFNLGIFLWVLVLITRPYIENTGKLHQKEGIGIEITRILVRC